MAQTLLRPEQVDDLVAQYREGATLVELASRFGVNRRTVAMHLTRREVTIRRGRFDPSRGNDTLIWPHRDGLIWPRVRHSGVVVTV